MEKGRERKFKPPKHCRIGVFSQSALQETSSTHHELHFYGFGFSFGDVWCHLTGQSVAKIPNRLWKRVEGHEVTKKNNGWRIKEQEEKDIKSKR